MSEEAVFEQITKLVTKVSEDYENFIFETIKPYCEEKTQMKISKRELVQALTLWRNNEMIKSDALFVIYSGDGYADGEMVYDMAECPKCGYEYEEDDKDWKEPFCPHCGQALIWDSEEESTNTATRKSEYGARE